MSKQNLSTMFDFPARILIVDDDIKTANQVREILQFRNYVVEITKISKNIIKEAQKHALKFRPHLVIIDIRLLADSTTDSSGMELIKALQGIRRILYSSYLSVEIAVEAMKKFGADNCINKAAPPERLLEAVDNILSKTWTDGMGIKIYHPSHWTPKAIIDTLFTVKDAVPADLVMDVLSQLFPDVTSISLTTISGQVVTSIPVNLDRSVTIKAELEDREPVIVKLAPTRKIVREVKSYDSYIKDRLGGQFHCQVRRQVVFWDLGGIVYSLLGNTGRTPIISFSEFYKREVSPQKILKPLNHLFNIVWERNYTRAISKTRRQSVFETYNKDLNLKTCIEHLIQQYAYLNTKADNEIKEMIGWISRHSSERYIQSNSIRVLHGDLHGDNIFVDGEHAWLVDFEHVGLSHIFRDLIMLEVDIITRLSDIKFENLNTLYAFAQMLYLSSPPAIMFNYDYKTLKMLNVVSGIRDLAKQFNHISRFQEYLWGTLFTFLATAARCTAGSYEQRQWLLICSVICQCLKTGDEAWPQLNAFYNEGVDVMQELPPDIANKAVTFLIQVGVFAISELKQRWKIARATMTVQEPNEKALLVEKTNTTDDTILLLLNSLLNKYSELKIKQTVELIGDQLKAIHDWKKKKLLYERELVRTENFAQIQFNIDELDGKINQGMKYIESLLKELDFVVEKEDVQSI